MLLDFCSNHCIDKSTKIKTPGTPARTLALTKPSIPAVAHRRCKMNTFSERFGSLRKEGETQKEFADRLGITQASISRYLRDQRPDRESINKICEVMGVSADWLLSGKEVEMAKEVDTMITKIGGSKPTDDKGWTEIMLSYFDKIGSLTTEEKRIYQGHPQETGG
jgi:transcriptional regulator with XRE-family HTH domain